MNDLKEGSLSDSLAAALKGHIPSTYCILMLLDGTGNLTTWMTCSQYALPRELRIGSVYGSDRMTAVRSVLDTGKPILYQLGSDTIDGDLKKMLSTDTSSVLIVPLKINTLHNGVIIYGNEHQENNGTFTNDQIECAVTISRQIEAVFTMCSCLEQHEELHTKFQSLYNKITRTTALASLGEVTRAVEHEINNPLSVIVNWSEVYREDASIDPELKKKFQIIYDMSMRIMEVIRKFSEMQGANPVELVKRKK